MNLNTGLGKYSGGGMMTLPMAEFNGGRLFGFYISRMHPVKIYLSTMKLYRGTHFSMKEIIPFSGRSIRLESDKPFQVETDGELHPPADAIRIGILPSCFDVVSGI